MEDDSKAGHDRTAMSSTAAHPAMQSGWPLGGEDAPTCAPIRISGIGLPGRRTKRRKEKLRGWCLNYGMTRPPGLWHTPCYRCWCPGTSGLHHSGPHPGSSGRHCPRCRRTRGQRAQNRRSPLPARAATVRAAPCSVPQRHCALPRPRRKIGRDASLCSVHARKCFALGAVHMCPARCKASEAQLSTCQPGPCFIQSDSKSPNTSRNEHQERHSCPSQWVARNCIDPHRRLYTQADHALHTTTLRTKTM